MQLLHAITSQPTLTQVLQAFCFSVGSKMMLLNLLDAGGRTTFIPFHSMQCNTRKSSRGRGESGVAVTREQGDSGHVVTKPRSRRGGGGAGGA